MKTVFTSTEIAHVWVHESAPSGRSPGNASFDGDAFKSYATVIGRRIRSAGRTAYILDLASFSNSTGKVQSRLRCSIPESEKVFNVRCGHRGQYLDFTPRSLRDHYISESKAILDENPSRYAFKRAEQWNRAQAALRSALEVCEFFGLPHLKLSADLAANEANSAQAADLIKARAASVP